MRIISRINTRWICICDRNKSGICIPLKNWALLLFFFCTWLVWWSVCAIFAYNSFVRFFFRSLFAKFITFLFEINGKELHLHIFISSSANLHIFPPLVQFTHIYVDFWNVNNTLEPFFSVFNWSERQRKKKRKLPFIDGKCICEDLLPTTNGTITASGQFMLLLSS